MAKRTPAQVYAQLIKAGASPAAARILTEIAGAESGWDDAAIGDVRLENNTWGPSVGEFQDRTLKSDTGKGTDRDIEALTGDDAFQAAAALRISHGGTDFSPWSTYTSGAYLREAPAVTAAIGAGAGGGASTAPAAFGLPSASGVLGGVRDIAVTGLFAALGVALVGVGIAHAAAPTVKRVNAAEDKLGRTAALAAL